MTIARANKSGILRYIIWIAIIIAGFWAFSVHSASVIGWEVISNALQGNSRTVVYRYELLDNNVVTTHRDWGPRSVPAATDLEADMAAIAPIVLIVQADEEVQNGINEDGNALCFFDGFWQKITPAWQTFDELFLKLGAYFLSQENQLDILQFEPEWTCSAISGADKRNTFGITNQQVSAITADMQIAVDMHDTLSAYVPPLDDEGVWVRP